MALTRRAFLMRTGAAGGYSAAFLMMQSLGLMPLLASAESVVSAAPGAGKGVKVAVLGGGIAGLVAAYELGKQGYECTVLEARERPGGRNWTVRNGTKIELDGYDTQTCAFDEGNYQNVGPARLPSIHGTILGYCRELGVELEVEVNTTRSSLLQNDKVAGGKPFVQRQLINDTRGHVAELLAKCTAQGALDQTLSKEDRDRILSFLRVYGPLDAAGAYTGSERAGYSVTPGAGDQTGILSKPIDLDTLLDSSFWMGMLFEETFDMQATMFQPKGGMDRIPYAFADKLGPVVKYKAPVKEIRKTAKGVHVTYTEGGTEKNLDADYCFCALPLSILKTTPNDFSPAHKKVIAECTYEGAYKVAWEARRFWEQDYNLYGGLSFLAQGCSPVWYPSAKLFSKRGVLVSGYTLEPGTPFYDLTLEQKFAESRASIERLHPGHGRELEKPLYVGWMKVPYNQGSWIGSYSPGVMRLTSSFPGPAYETVIQPDGPIYFIGDHASYLIGWQEGAALSAHRAINLLNERVRSARLAGQAAPLQTA
jgi:monoamine oxidase